MDLNTVSFVDAEFDLDLVLLDEVPRRYLGFLILNDVGWDFLDLFKYIECMVCNSVVGIGL